MKKTTLLLISAIVAGNLQAQSLEDLMKAAGQNNKVTVEENNDPFQPLGFTGSYRMEVHSYKGGAEEKDSPMNVRMAFTDEKMVMAPEGMGKGKEQVRMVYDLKNRYTYTLMTDDKGQKTGIKMRMMKVHVNDTDDQDDSDRTQVVRTDETREIEGHRCRKYTYTDKDGAGEAWIAEDIDFDPMRAMNSVVGGQKAERWQETPYSGMLMETTWNAANGKEKVVMYTKDLVVGKVDEALFSTAGHQMMEMPSMGGMGR